MQPEVSASVYLVKRTYRNYYGVQRGDYIVRVNDIAYRAKAIDVDTGRFIVSTQEVINMSKVSATYIANRTLTVKELEENKYRTELCQIK